MPIIRKQVPLFPPGHYCGFTGKCTQRYVPRKKTVINPNPDDALVFDFQIRMKDGKVLKHTMWLTENTMWIVPAFCRSTNIALPDSEAYYLTTDDVEHRRVYFEVVHTVLDDGRTVQNLRFHTPTYTIQNNPSLAGVTFPGEAPATTLRAVEAAPPQTDSDENGTAGAQASVQPPPPAPSQPAAKPVPSEEDLEGISDEEMAEALAYAKKLREQKAQGNPSGKA
jgi:hypothetical protein